MAPFAAFFLSLSLLRPYWFDSRHLSCNSVIAKCIQSNRWNGLESEQNWESMPKAREMPWNQEDQHKKREIFVYIEYRADLPWWCKLDGVCGAAAFEHIENMFDCDRRPSTTQLNTVRMEINTQFHRFFFRFFFAFSEFTSAHTTIQTTFQLCFVWLFNKQGFSLIVSQQLRRAFLFKCVNDASLSRFLHYFLLLLLFALFVSSLVYKFFSIFFLHLLLSAPSYTANILSMFIGNSL